MRITNGVLPALIFALILKSSNMQAQSDIKLNSGNMMVRIAEIELFPEYVDKYKAILKEESEASVSLEAGVICIFPMLMKDNPASVRLLEIYADRNAYEAHLKTPHFQNYKTATLKMVKSLQLVDMTALDPGTMPMLFRKFRE